MTQAQIEDREFNQCMHEQYKREFIRQWLKDNPEVVELNGGRYYRIINGEIVYCKPGH
ncbi:hypothetical protein [Halioglobus sp. HI00S01]|uniref:hypothetical protein n=1 Tax=Halioglobus sp. HI00S01 TaxID=1822214 RepID=UPI0012E8FFE0|nr:hypothetical protein [Halioglobus sp. HI00S01]